MIEAVFKSAQLSLTFLFLLGMGIYFIDRRPLWQAIYRWVYDFFHSAKNAMPKDKVRGIFYNQPAKQKWTRVGIASTIIFVIQIWEAKLNVNLLAEVVVWVLGFPTMLLGIYIAYQAQEKLFPNKDKLFASADRLSEQLDNASVAAAATVLKETGGKVAGGFLSRVRESLKRAAPPEKVEPPAPPSTEDVRARLRRTLES